jgi:hypothetical protein
VCAKRFRPGQGQRRQGIRLAGGGVVVGANGCGEPSAPAVRKGVGAAMDGWGGGDVVLGRKKEQSGTFITSDSG